MKEMFLLQTNFFTTGKATKKINDNQHNFTTVKISKQKCVLSLTVNVQTFQRIGWKGASFLEYILCVP